MKLKKKIRRFIHLFLWSLLVAGAGFLLGFADYEQNGTICRSLHYNLIYGEADMLIKEAEIDSMIRSVSGGVKGQPLFMINTEKLERAISRNPYVASVHVYSTHAGEIYVNVVQRDPIIRIITETNKSYFIGAKGLILPFHSGYPVRVLVATGAIPDTVIARKERKSKRMVADSAATNPLLADLYKLALRINRDPFLKAQVEQVYVNQKGDYELIPKVGNHLIVLGNAEDLEDKFKRLMAFYKQGLNHIGWNKYHVINIKYKNQVVCSKL